MYDIFILYYTSRVHSSWIEREGGEDASSIPLRIHFDFIWVLRGFPILQFVGWHLSYRNS